MAKWARDTGIVVDIRFIGPVLAPEWKGTTIIVDLDKGGRISALLEPKFAKKNPIVIGDRIFLEYQPGKEAKIGGCLGRKKGLCRNVEVLQPVSRSGK